MKNIDLKGQRALVIGGNSGIGKATSIALGKAGAAVGINYIEDEQAAQDITRII